VRLAQRAVDFKSTAAAVVAKEQLYMKMLEIIGDKRLKS
jgi:hypothetical protein